MLIFVAFLYFCLACSVIWLLVFPSGRDFVLRQIRQFGQRLGSKGAQWQQAQRRHGRAWRQGTARVAGRALGLLRRRARWVGLCLAVVIVPSIVALSLSSPAMLPNYEAVELAPDAQVAALLEGEMLAPPVALPPLAFTTQEVELVRPMLVDASRNWGLLHPEFEQRLLLAFKIMKEKYGYDMALLEGYRSPARQDMLANMGSQVSNARAFQSYHQYGLAADCAFWRDGKLIISEKNPWAMRGYRLYGEVAETLGLTWGGRWTMMDFGHAELRLRGTVRK